MTKSHHRYHPGEIALSCDLHASHKHDAAAEMTALTLLKGDGAFIKRSDGTWRYCVVQKVHLHENPPHITFLVEKDGSTKRVDIGHWGDRVRPLKKRRAELLHVVKTEGKEAFLKKGHRVFPVKLDAMENSFKSSNSL